MYRRRGKHPKDESGRGRLCRTNPYPKWAAVPSILAFRFLSAFSCSDSAARR